MKKHSSNQMRKQLTRKKYLLLFFWFSLVITLSAQEKEVYQSSIYQYDNTENELIYYFSDLVPPNNRKTLVILLPPMKCPRCEGSIKPFLHKYYRTAADPYSICIILGNESKSIRKYLKKRKIPADTLIIDKPQKLINSLRFSSGAYSVPHFLLFDTKDGLLLNACTSLGINLTDKFIKDFVKSDKDLIIERPKKDDFERRSLSRLPDTNRIMEFKYDSVYQYIVDDSVSMDNLTSFNFSANGNHLTFIDELTNEVSMLMKTNGNYELINTLSPSIYEENLHIDQAIGDTLILFLKKAGIINTMYLKAIIDNKGVVTISASLPKVNYYLKNDGEKAVAYYNRPTVIKSFPPYLKKEYIGLEEEPFLVDSTKSYLHKAFYTLKIEGKEKVYLPVNKGWPTVGNELSPPSADHINPFKEKFYENIPLFAIFDNEGDFQYEFGKLDDLYKKLKTGYYYSSPLIKYIDEHHWIGDRLTGNVTVVGNEPKKNKSYSIFDNTVIPINDQSGTLEDIKNYSQYFDYKVMDFLPFNNTIVAIVSNDKEYIITQTDEDTTQKITSLRNSFNKVPLEYATLCYNEKGEVKVYSIYAKNQQLIIGSGIFRRDF